jgi:5-methylthioadenosine/S-adenosylhomocysteine deaminase
MPLRSPLVIRNGTVVTQAGAGTVRADVLIEDGRVTAVEKRVPGRAGAEIDAVGCIVTPGLVQTHVHLCQTAFSGLAEDLDVMSWLDRWVWPLEQALDAETMAASARLGVAEMLLTGTTAFLSMETVHHTDRAFEAAIDLGARAVIGKAIMDRAEPGTVLFGETTDDARRDFYRLLDRWHGAAEGRIGVAASPRAPSAATQDLWREVTAAARRAGLTVHTHANENRGQSELVSQANGGRDVSFLAGLGALGPRTVLAHCVWLDEAEVGLLAATGTSVAHCPTANLKLGSGIADVPGLARRGVNVGVGTDGAACNNALDVLREVRLAALIHRSGGNPAAMPAARAFDMATRNGARALGLDGEIGAIAPGMRADVVVWDTPQFHAGTGEAAVDHLVYSGSGASARTVVVDGRVVVDDHQLTAADAAAIRRDGAAARQALRTVVSPADSRSMAPGGAKA